MDFDFERIARSPSFIGALGAIVALRWAPGSTWKDRVFNVLCGGICAHFCAPGVCEWWHITSAGMQALFAFGVGVFGLSMVAAVANAIKEIKLADIATGWLRRKE